MSGTTNPPTDHAPAPPTDLPQRTLLCLTHGESGWRGEEAGRLSAGTAVWRIARVKRAKEPCFYGPLPGDPPMNRWDDPRRSEAAATPPVRTFGVCYLGLSPEAAFAETFLRRQERVLDRAFLAAHVLAVLRTTRPLRLVAMTGAGLARAGATAAVTHGPQSGARPWSRALWTHPASFDGLAARCRHDDDEHAVALYDRAADALELTSVEPVDKDPIWFAATLQRYGLALEAR